MASGVPLSSIVKAADWSNENTLLNSTEEGLISQSINWFGVEHKLNPAQASNKSVIKSKTDQERKNEIFIDIVERMVAVIDCKGVPQRCQVQGHVNMKTFLMGNPEVKLAFNDSLVLNKEADKGYGKQIYLEEVKFHSCVGLRDINSEKVITVQPPEGEFSLMTYKLNGDLVHGLPLRFYSYVTSNPSSRDLEVGLKVRCEIPSSCAAVSVNLQLPLPKSVKSVSQQLGGPEQTAEFIPNKNVLEWKIKKIPGKTEMAGHFKLIEGNLNPETSVLELGPASMDFEISGFLCSNLQVKNLRVLEREQSYVPSKWVRYITTPDSYIVKLH